MTFLHFCFAFLFYLNGVQVNGGKPVSAAGEPLFLTPYIRDGLIIEARELSRVQNLSPALPSYSGLITVNSSTNANMFFWFFPAQRMASTAPVILWCEGGPGASGLFSLFNENGPYTVDKELHLNLREHSWHLENNIIFTDNPIGAGFSFSDNVDGRLKSGTDAEHLYNFLTQFYTMFPEYQKNDFYAAGVSFGGIFAPSIAHRIHVENLGGSPLQINLKGLLVESPWSDPVRQLNYGDFIFNIGFIDEFDREHINGQTELMEGHINSGRWSEAYDIWTSTLIREWSYLFNRTKLEREILYNYVGHGSAEDTSEFYIPFVEQEFVRNAIHVGDLKYVPFDGQSQILMEDKGLKSVKPYIETLLNATERYRVMFYAGQLDVITFHLGVRRMIESLEWGGAEEFKDTITQPWKANGGDLVSGFVTSARNLTYVLMRNAGHDANSEQPAWGLDIVTRFTKNLPFTS